MNKKTILFISKFIPAPAFDGGALRNKAWLEFFLNKHEVILIGFWNKKYSNSRVSELNRECLKIYGFNFDTSLIRKLWLIFKCLFLNESFLLNQYWKKEIKTKITEILNKENIEFIFCSELSTMVYVKDLNKDLPVYFDDHNAEFKLLERRAANSSGLGRFLFNKESKIVKSFERWAIEKSNKVFVVSEKDKELLSGVVDFDNKFNIVNNVFADHGGFRYNELSLKPKLIFVGNLSWLPNRTGLSYFLKKIFPIVVRIIPEVSFDIVGANLPKDLIRQSFGLPVNFFSELEEKEKDKLIASAWVGVVPLYFASGSRIKILEFWSQGKTVVSTKIGAEGLFCSDGTMVVDSDQEFINSLINTLKQKEKLTVFGLANYSVFKQNYLDKKVYEDSLYHAFSS